MLRIWTSARTFRSEGSVKAWLMRIVARESIRIIKSAKRKSVKMESEAINKNEDSGLSPLIDAESSELAMALRKEFNKLPSLERQLVGLHFGGALTQQEISEALSMPQQTVSRRPVTRRRFRSWPPTSSARCSARASRLRPGCTRKSFPA
jgi:RNA polymerase sigma factor (sigma-70 family)